MEKLRIWLQTQKKDGKRVLIGGVIFSFYVLISKFFGIKIFDIETDISIVESFFEGIFLTAIFINGYRFLRWFFNKDTWLKIID